MPPNNYSRVLEGLKRPALLGKQDWYQEDYLTSPDPDMGQPDDNLSGYRRKDPSLTLNAFQNNMQGELRDRSFQAARLGETNEVDALQGLLSGYKADQEDSPLTRQRAQVRGYEDATQAAQMAGFPTTQEAAHYDRGLAQQKLDQPIREAEIRGQTAVAQARAQGEEARRIEQQRADNDYRLLQNAGGGDLSHYGRSGTGRSFSWRDDERDANGQPKPMGGYSTVLKGVRDAVDNFERSRGTGNEAAAKATLDATREQLLASTLHVDPTIRDMVSTIVNTPGTERLNEEQIVQGVMNQYDTRGISESEWIQFKELLRQLR